MQIRAWQYESAFVTSQDTRWIVLQQRGLEGWELVAIEGRELLFKRPIQRDEITYAHMWSKLRAFLSRRDVNLRRAVEAMDSIETGEAGKP